LVFVPDGVHLSWEEYLKNPVDTLEKHKARIVGRNTGTTVETNGSKRLESKPYIWDRETADLLSKGELGISTDFYCPVVDDKLSGPVTPNYIAVFPIKSQNEQNDLAARFMNSASSAQEQKTEEEMDSETITVEKNAFERLNIKFDTLLEVLKGVFTHQNSSIVQEPPPAPAPPALQTEELGALKSEKESLATELDATKASLEELQAKEQEWIAEQKAAELEAKKSQWNTIKQTLPAGLIHGEEKEKEVETEWFTDPTAFFMKYLQQINRSEEFLHANSAQGQTFSNSAKDEESDENPITIGSYDATKKEFVI
jgi:hypothetical protein